MLAQPPRAVLWQLSPCTLRPRTSAGHTHARGHTRAQTRLCIGVGYETLMGWGLRGRPTARTQAQGGGAGHFVLDARQQAQGHVGRRARHPRAHAARAGASGGLGAGRGAPQPVVHLSPCHPEAPPLPITTRRRRLRDCVCGCGCFESH